MSKSVILTIVGAGIVIALGGSRFAPFIGLTLVAVLVYQMLSKNSPLAQLVS